MSGYVLEKRDFFLAAWVPIGDVEATDDAAAEKRALKVTKTLSLARLRDGERIVALYRRGKVVTT